MKKRSGPGNNGTLAPLKCEKRFHGVKILGSGGILSVFKCVAKIKNIEPDHLPILIPNTQFSHHCYITLKKQFLERDELTLACSAKRQQAFSFDKKDGGHRRRNFRHYSV